MNIFLKKYDEKFYKSKEWREKRNQILKRDNHECQRCKGKGRVTKAETVHHIRHYQTFPKLALTDKNLISLCNACHNAVHPEKAFSKKRVEVHKAKWK